MKQVFFLLIAVLSLKAGLAQDSAASVIVHKDPRLDQLVKKQAAINAAVKKATSHTARGFRLLVVNTSNREEALAAKTRIYTLFPELKAYLSYQSPYYKLKAGNFQTRAEAESYRKTMTSLFPKGVFIVNDVIEVKAETNSVEVEDLP